MTHGKIGTYTSGCRCDDCRTAMTEWGREYRRRNGPPVERRESARRIHFEAMRDLLLELAPDGLTDDCPARRTSAVA